MRRIGRLMYGSVSVLLVLALFFGGGYHFGLLQSNKAETVATDKTNFDLTLPGEVEKRIVTAEDVEVKLVEISQFATFSGEYNVSKSADYTRYLLDNIPVPGTTNTIVFNCSGIVKVGYDVNNIATTVDNDSQTIYISLPVPAVLDNYLMWDSISCSETNNILNPIDFSQYQTLITEIEDIGLAQAESGGIYKEAEDKIKVIIRNFLLGFDEYEIVFL